jgi:hypothetical protein
VDYTVIMPVRQHFGDEPGSYDFPFAGMTTLNQVPPFDPKPEWLFDCPNVDSSQPAILMFESIGVDHDRNQFEINGTPIAGGIPISATSDHWSGNVMLVSARTLTSQENFLLVVSHDERGSNLGNQDDFGLDNIVILYKTIPWWRRLPELRTFARSRPKRRPRADPSGVGPTQPAP